MDRDRRPRRFRHAPERPPSHALSTTTNNHVSVSLLDLPGRRHPLHVLGLLARDDELRFGQIVQQTGHRDAEVARALAYLKDDHLVRARTLEACGSRVILSYSLTARGRAAWQALQAYRQAIRDRAGVFGQDELAAVDRAMAA